MPNVPITQLPAALPIQGDELVPIVQGGVTVRTTTGAISASPSQNQTFITLNQEPTLPNSRYLSGNNGISLLDGGAQSDLSIELTGTALSLQNAASGLLFKVSGNIVPRTLESGSSGISVANGLGVAGNPSISLSGRVLDLQTLGGSSGLVALTAGSVTSVDITGTANQIAVANGGGPGNPTISLVSNPVIPGLQGMVLPKGATGDRASVPAAGEIRYNTSTSRFEGYTTGWNTFGQGDGTVTSVNVASSSSGLSFTGGPITTSGTITLVGVPTLAGNLQGGSANRIPYQTGVDTTSFISAPTFTDTYLKWSGSSFIWATLPGSGTVTSVGLALPSEFTISGSPVTTTGTLTGAWASQTANLFFASPDGTSGTPSFRAIVPADVPTLNQNTTGNAATATTATNIVGGAAGSIPYQTGANTTTMLAAGTGVLVGGTSPTYSTTPSLTGTNFTGIPNAALNNSSVTYNGVTVALGASGTITAASPSALTIGTGLTGTSYDGSAPVTIAIDSTVATLTGLQTLTNKSMSGASNTFTNIPNNALSNYTISGVALGGNLFPLTIGTGLTGSSYDGSGNITVAIDSTVVTLSGSQTLTNKSISGSTNTLTNIPNSALTNSSVTIGTTNVALGGTVTTLAGLTSITLTQDPVSDLQVATKQYVDSIASGLNYHQPVNYASTAALPAYTYNNGTGGVGATITANANGALSFGGGSPTAGQRLLVKDEAGANQPYNGIYTVTSAGSAGSPFQLTRATDYDTSGTGTNEIDAGDYVLVISGTNASTAWVQQTPLPIVVGTTAIVFLQFNAPITYTAGTGLNLSPSTTFNISNTGVTAATYGSASSVPTIAVNAQGQITSASNTAIAINGNQITSGTVGSAYISGSYTGITGVGTLTAGTWNATAIDPAYGGTGLSSYAVGNLIYATGTTTLSKLAIGTSGQYLSSSGTAPQWSSPAALTKTDDTNVTLTLGGSPTTALLNAASITVGWTGQLATTRGGTGLSSYTAGDLLYYSTGTALSKLGIGTSTQILTSSGTAPQWTTPSSITVGTATNATNTAITANSTNATNYLTFVSATTGNLPQLVNSSITCNPSTGAITGGIAGGTF